MTVYWTSCAAFPARYIVSRTGRAAAMEYYFTCPYCWERISMVLDVSVRGQTWIEDCEVCCHPIQVRYVVRNGEVAGFEARSLE